MPSVFTIQGASSFGAARGRAHTCKCVRNPRTKKGTLLCFVGKSKKAPTGWKFVKGGCRR